MTPTVVTAARARFLAFDRMSALQQAEHLVLAHGMTGDYFSDCEAAGRPAADVVLWLLGWPEVDRRRAHSDDHDYLDAEPGVLACEHTHDKPGGTR